MAMILKVSSQGQVTLPLALRQRLGKLRYLEVEAVDDAQGRLLLRKAHAKTVEEVAGLYGRHGLTKDLLVEALRILDRRKRVAEQRAAEAREGEAAAAAARADLAGEDEGT